MAQEYHITFAILGQSSTPDSVYLENIDQSINLTINGDDILHLVSEVTGLDEFASNNDLLRVYPNPTQENAIIEFSYPQVGQMSIQLFDIQGRSLISQTRQLDQGINSFTLSGLSSGSYVFRIDDGMKQASVIIISQNETGDCPNLQLNSHATTAPNQMPVFKGSKQASGTIQLQYNAGDKLNFTAYLDQKTCKIENLVPDSSQTLEFGF